MFSWSRFIAVMIKEFCQMRRDRLTFAMLIAVPLMQLILFGFAINTNPHHLPMAVVSPESTPLTRDFIAALENTNYFKVTQMMRSQQKARQALDEGKVMFVLNIPPNFSDDIRRGKQPSALLEVDGTDPVAGGSAISAALHLSSAAMSPDLRGPYSVMNKVNMGPFQILLHTLYNPEGKSQYNIVPGLLGVVLTMTMVMITSLALTRERERGTMESLLSTPVLPIEIMCGKVLPYVVMGYVQVILILFLAKLLFNIPMLGSISLLCLAILPFIAANLSLGLMFSSVAANQLQAMQMAFFFFLPSILLSGFMFPFDGMPSWAQWIGQVLPLTHFLRIVRGILLKGNGFMQIWPNLWPVLLFMLATMGVGIKRFRQTLD